MLQCAEEEISVPSVSDSGDDLAQTTSAGDGTVSDHGDDSFAQESTDSSVDSTDSSVESTAELAQESTDSSVDSTDSSVESTADLAQEDEEIGSNWSSGEWEDPCRHLAPCADIMDNDPCEDADDWSACHEGPEGQAWAEELGECLDNKTEEQWAAELHCIEGLGN